MRWLLLLSCYFISPASWAQADSARLARSNRMTQSGCQRLIWLTNDPSGAAAVALAERDIQAGTPYLILTRGEAPVVITTDAAFERQFNVDYFEMGCISPSLAAVRAYNSRMFTYLQATYGKA